MDGKTAGMIFGGAAIVAGLSYLSRRSSSSMVETAKPLGPEALEAIERLNQKVRRPFWTKEDVFDASFLCDGVSSEDCVRIAEAMENGISLRSYADRDINALKSKPKRLKEIQKVLSRVEVPDRVRAARKDEQLASKSTDVDGAMAAISLQCVGNASPLPHDLFEKLQAASRLPEHVRRRVMAAEIERNGKRVCGNVADVGIYLWHGALAPSYPDLNREDAAKVATGTPIQEVFAPIPIEQAKKTWKHQDSKDIRLDHLRKKCSKLAEPAKRLAAMAEKKGRPTMNRTPEERELETLHWRYDAFLERVSDSPLHGTWLDSVCGDPLREDALVARREFPHALNDGERYESSYLEEMLGLFEDYGMSAEDISNMKASPEAVHRGLRAKKARMDLERYESASGKKAAPIPRWWPEDEVRALDEEGSHLRLLRTCKDVVQEGIELDHCIKDPKRYCPPVATGKSVLISMKLDPEVDPSGARRTSEHRSTMELRTDKGRVPRIAQHYGYRDSKVENPRAIEVRDRLVAAIQERLK